MKRLRIDVASAATHIPASTIRRWLSEGRITSDKQGKWLTVNPEEINTLRQMLANRRGREQ